MDAAVNALPSSDRLVDSPTTMNASVAIERDMKWISVMRPILSEEDFFTFMSLIIYAFLFLALIGIVSNLLVIITCTKIGFSETINMSYLTLGISDLLASVIRFYVSILILLDITNMKLHFDPFTVTTVIGFLPGQGFEKTSAFITAFIALERCLCVQFPLHVKRIVTKKKTIFSNVMIYIFAFGPSNLIHIAYRFKWVFNETQNRTILVIDPLETQLRYILSRALYAYYGTALHFTSLVVVWICTVYLVLGLKRKAVTRKEHFKTSFIKEDKLKDIRVIKTVFLLAVTYLACSIPSAITLLVPQFVQEFESTRALARINRVSLMISNLMMQVNSCTNFFILLYMGSKFRQAFMRLFGKQ
ncbi:chemosensory receptor a [Plakobranchus ocellatus]|uniref:Chemosensory receptor a n=1 Tax=Plakobranchus ocellatus TaxID=259542 RepID=A0AAV3ZT15_9GAST|nr:chemosensory receptor a [Plakobranchus ocellatus]